MKGMEDRVMKKIFGFVCGLMVSLLVGTLTARADVVLDWNAIAVNTAVANNQNPIAQARYAAIVQLAVFEAVNSITHKYQPYLGTITAPADASPDAAAVEAAYQVLSSLLRQPARFSLPTTSTRCHSYRMARRRLTASQQETPQLRP